MNRPDDPWSPYEPVRGRSLGPREGGPPAPPGRLRRDPGRARARPEGRPGRQRGSAPRPARADLARNARSCSTGCATASGTPPIPGRAAQGVLALPDRLRPGPAAGEDDALLARAFRHQQPQGPERRADARAERAVPPPCASATSASWRRRSSPTRRCWSGSTASGIARRSRTRTWRASSSSCSPWASATTPRPTSARRPGRSPAGSRKATRATTRPRIRFDPATVRRRHQDVPGPDRPVERRPTSRGSRLEQPAAAEHLARKLYRFFVRDDVEPGPELIGPLADRIRSHGFSIRDGAGGDPPLAAFLLGRGAPAPDQGPGRVHRRPGPNLEVPRGTDRPDDARHPLRPAGAEPVLPAQRQGLGRRPGLGLQRRRSWPGPTGRATSSGATARWRIPSPSTPPPGRGRRDRTRETSIDRLADLLLQGRPRSRGAFPGDPGRPRRRRPTGFARASRSC